jgi:hypothetical protein
MPGVNEESAALLRRLRTDAGLTQAEFGRGHRSAEAGGYPRPRWRLKLASYFNRKPSDIWPVE